MPRAGTTFTFRTRRGNDYEIYIIALEDGRVVYEYLHSNERSNVTLEQWQEMMLDHDTITEISRLTR
jgi:hypothetical protein